MKNCYLDECGYDSLWQLRLASRNKCHYFITNNKGMLEDKKELEKKFKIKIRTPEEMLKEVDFNECLY